MKGNTTYKLLDFGAGKRLEQWGEFRLVRPDPTAHGALKYAHEWQSIDAVYEGEKGKGRWIKKHTIPELFSIQCDDIKMVVKLAPYKHTGIFPEQRQNWSWMRRVARAANRPITVLNLFAYTGGATMAMSSDGHFVTHVDSSKPAITWAKENQRLNCISADLIRWILDDALQFAAREIKRGKRYDAILLDPPAIGHSPTGKTWRVERDLTPLLEKCVRLLSEDPAFLLINGYAQNETPKSFQGMLEEILEAHSAHSFAVESEELFLTAEDGRRLSTGIVARCIPKKDPSDVFHT